VNDLPAIRRAAGQCLKRVDLTRRIRLLGVRAGTLVRARDLPAAPAGQAEPERELFGGD
jgi:DNA polymerase-4